MPPSGRGKGKTRGRRGAASTNASDAVQEPSDVGTPEAVATPTRSSRKRGRGGAEASTQQARNVRRKIKDMREDTEGTEAPDGSDNDTTPALPSEQEIIASLKVAERQVNATEDFANDLLEGQENVPGYGKIAGRDWAFIIRKVEVNIGRPEAHERLTTDTESNQATASAKTVVDIDLGPDRQVSRSHAIISYDPDAASWFIVVNGRNGLRVDNNLLRRGTKSYLRNGSVIEIAGTQMAFITSAAEDSDGPVWDGSIIRQAQKSSEEDEEEGEDEVGANGGNHAHPRRGTLQASRLPPEYNTHQSQHRPHPHSARATAINTTFPLQPGTPIRTASTTNPYAIKSSPNANYVRGITMDSTESIDYSSNAAKDLKPPHSYAQLIGMAILSTSEQQMTLSNIYKWIMANYAFYRFNTGGWQNSIRHNLSLNKAFSKIARRTDEPGKGMKWMIEPTEFETFVSQGMKGCRRPPIQVMAHSQLSATQTTLAEASSPLAMRNGLKNDMTPPLLPYAASSQARHEALTPDHGSARGAGPGIHDESAGVAAETLDFLRTTPRNGLTAAANAAGSPPALFVPEDGRIAAGLDTPFPLKPTQRLAPPSTLRRPSDFIQFSSPAPFWKMEGLVGNTPWKFDISPLKTPFTGFTKEPKVEHDDEKNVDEKEEDVDDIEDKATADDDDGDEGVHDTKPITDGAARKVQSPVIPSSSPPRPTSGGLAAAVANGSPTATRPGSRLAMSSQPSGGAKGLSLLAAATREAEKDALQQTVHQRPASALQQPRYSNSFTNGYGYSNQQHYSVSQPPAQVDPGLDDGDDEGIDLAKGFQPIGAFHQKQRNSRFRPAPIGMPVGVTPSRGSFGR